MMDKKMKMGKGSKPVKAKVAKGMMPMGYADGGKAKGKPFMKGGLVKGKKGC